MCQFKAKSKAAFEVEVLQMVAQHRFRLRRLWLTLGIRFEQGKPKIAAILHVRDDKAVTRPLVTDLMRSKEGRIMEYLNCNHRGGVIGIIE